MDILVALMISTIKIVSANNCLELEAGRIGSIEILAQYSIWIKRSMLTALTPGLKCTE